MNLLVSLIIVLVAIAVIFWLLNTVIPMPPPLKTIALAVFGVLALLVLLGLLFGQLPLPRFYGSIDPPHQEVKCTTLNPHVMTTTR